MIMYHLGPQLGVWIMQVSTFSRVLINRFYCSKTAIQCAGHFPDRKAICQGIFTFSYIIQ